MATQVAHLSDVPREKDQRRQSEISHLVPSSPICCYPFISLATIYSFSIHPDECGDECSDRGCCEDEDEE
jgi:hypothetical protein